MSGQNPSARTLAIKVVPNASRDQISGWLGDRLKVRVRQPAESGRANEAVVKLLAGVLGLSRSDVTITQGHTQALKTVTLTCEDIAMLERRIEALG